MTTRPEQTREVLDHVLWQVKDEMERTGLSRTELAASLGTTQGYVTNLLDGRKGNPTLATLIKLGTAVGLSLKVTME